MERYPCPYNTPHSQCTCSLSLFSFKITVLQAESVSFEIKFSGARWIRNVWGLLFLSKLIISPTEIHLSAISHFFFFHLPFPFLVSVSQLSPRWQLCPDSFEHSGSCWHCTGLNDTVHKYKYKYAKTQIQIQIYTNTNLRWQLCLSSSRHSGSCWHCTQLNHTVYKYK